MRAAVLITLMLAAPASASASGGGGNVDAMQAAFGNTVVSHYPDGDWVKHWFAKYAKGTRLNWVLLIGGVSMGDQVAALNKGVDVLIATPGRLLDLFDRGKMLLTGVELMVVDEADRMLDMGFIPDIERIFKLTPPRRQTLFFSATMPPEITRLTQQFLKDPTRIEVARPATTADTITQHITRLSTSDLRLQKTMPF